MDESQEEMPVCVIKKCEVCVFKKHQHQWTSELFLSLVLYYCICGGDSLNAATRVPVNYSYARRVV